MSEELHQRNIAETGLRLGNYEFFNIGSSTLKQLKKFKIVPNKDYKKYEARKPDALLVDRRNARKVRVLAVIEYKDTGKTDKEAIEQCNDLCQVLGAPIGIATDSTSFIWFNPNHPDLENAYFDRTTGEKRSYTLITDLEGRGFIEPFIIDQQADEKDHLKLAPKSKKAIDNINLIINHINSRNSKILPPTTVDPTNLAKQIWQDVWSVSGATPEKCLYTFVEIFIFKYLSDLGILDEDDKGNKVNFKDIFALAPEKAFKNYSENARRHLKAMFPASKEDNTTIINGTVLSPDVPEHSKVFYKILKKFNDFGELKNIDPGFKSRVFESFMKESISKKNWGQFFTPRNIIDAIIEISEIENLPIGADVCDPACGVGGFILEPIKVKNKGLKFFYDISGSTLQPRLNFHGFDKGFEREEQLTIILAKANMLIFLSELLQGNPTLSLEFSRIFNKTFKLLSNTILGTLALTEKDKYDLILTNPPYVTSGSSNYKEAIKNDSGLSNFYKINAIGVEGLFMEWIVRSLKPGRKAFVIIPDGILNRLNDAKLRRFLREECFIDGIISLPVNAFYTTPKKTYILALTKKSGRDETERKKEIQTNPVFTYLVSNIGETLDIKRFTIPENDLNEAVSLFNQFKGAKASFSSNSLRCKIQPIQKFDPDNHWSVDRWWDKIEKVELGIEEEEEVLSLEEFKEKFEDTLQTVAELSKQLQSLK